jgi:hypothetical protein
MGRPVQADEIPLQPQMVLEPFKKRAIDFVIPINPPSHRHYYILISTNYVTKWMEEKSIPSTTEQEVVEFLHEEFFVTFEIPREIVTHGGAHFTSWIVIDMMYN